MGIQIKHHFGLDRGLYRELLEIALGRFSFSDFLSGPLQEGQLIWRHDVDFSLESAVSLAKIDADYGIRSTFFLRFRAETYNVFESRNQDFVAEIASYGHSLGLHFEALTGDGTDDQSLSAALIRDTRQLVAGGIKEPIETFSFHNTTPDLLEFRNHEYGGLINAYASEFMQPNKYSSDSGGYWRHAPIKDFLVDPKVDRGQVLTHPEWWLAEDMPPWNKIAFAAVAQRNQAMAKYQDDLMRFGLPINKGSFEDLENFACESGGKVPEKVRQLWLDQDFELLVAWLILETFRADDNDLTDVRNALDGAFTEVGVADQLSRYLAETDPMSPLYHYAKTCPPGTREELCLALAKLICTRSS